MDTGKRWQTGRLGEEQALVYLRNCGHTLLEKNYRTRFGEIDLITLDGEVLVFTEVRTRTSCRFGFPLESVNAGKIRKLRRMAEAYLSSTGQQHRSIRFDVIGINHFDEDAGITHVIGAF